MGELPSAEERKYLWLALRKTVDLLGQGYILDLALCLYGTETEKGQSENIFWNKKVSNSTNFIKSHLVIFIGSTNLC